MCSLFQIIMRVKLNHFKNNVKRSMTRLKRKITTINELKAAQSIVITVQSISSFVSICTASSHYEIHVVRQTTVHLIASYVTEP